MIVASSRELSDGLSLTHSFHTETASGHRASVLPSTSDHTISIFCAKRETARTEFCDHVCHSFRLRTRTHHRTHHRHYLCLLSFQQHTSSTERSSLDSTESTSITHITLQIEHKQDDEIYLPPPCSYCCRCGVRSSHFQCPSCRYVSIDLR